jgi:hypothetical protein
MPGTNSKIEAYKCMMYLILIAKTAFVQMESKRTIRIFHLLPAQDKNNRNEPKTFT